MKEEIKIGDTVITQQYKKEDGCTSNLEQFFNKEGVVTDINKYGRYEVHDYWWIPSACKKVNKEVMNNTKQYLTRKQLIEAHNTFNCSDWREPITSILRNYPMAYDEQKFEISPLLIETVNKKATVPQKKWLKDNDIILVEDKSVEIKDNNKIFSKTGRMLLQRRDSHEFENIAFYLDNCFNWELKTDSWGILCLVPTLK